MAEKSWDKAEKKGIAECGKKHTKGSKEYNSCVSDVGRSTRPSKMKRLLEMTPDEKKKMKQRQYNWTEATAPYLLDKKEKK